MSAKAYIVTKGGKPCALAHVAKLKRDVLIVGVPVAVFRGMGPVDTALKATMSATSQLRGTRRVDNPKTIKDDAHLFAVVPVREVK